MEKRIIDELKSDQKLKIKSLYFQYRDEFLNFSKKYHLRQEDLVDIYQEAFITMHQKALFGKLSPVKCSFKTYLFAVAKNMIYDKFRLDKKFVQNKSLDHMAHEEPVDFEVSNKVNLTTQQILLREGFRQLSDQSKRIITLFYYRGLSLQEIAELEGYKSVNVVKATKSRAIKFLKEKVNLIKELREEMVTFS